MMRIDAPWLRGPSRCILTMLSDADFQAWYVGGCVRNALLGTSASDLDVTTDALPEQVIALAEAAGLKAIPTGIDHGTVTIVVEGETFEVTTFRRDVATDGRRAVVAFSDTIKDDARRRDFTVNALYCDVDGLVADPLGGLPDLETGQIRFIDDPVQRIQEDYLRIMRFFRFTAWYGGDGIDPEGLAACGAHVDGLDGLSAERVTSELLKLLAAPDPAPAVAAMDHSGVLMRVLPGAAPDVLTVLVHLEQDQNLPPDPMRRLVALGGDFGRLRLSKVQQRRIDQIRSDVPQLEQANRYGFEIARDRYLIENASLTQAISAEKLNRLEWAAKQILPVRAADFMPEKSGAALGETLRDAQDRWIASGFTLTREDLLG